MPVPTSARIQNVTCTPADTEVSLTLPASTNHFAFQARPLSGVQHDIRFSFDSGQVAGPTNPYATLLAGDIYASPENLSPVANIVIYFACATNNVEVELVSWE